MDMSERKLQILQAIIMNYQETAEPVGSRTISRRFMMNLSSATIRNEMSDLEDMGLIEQPHTSAGRIPSAKGYRLYVDRLMKNDPRKMEETSSLLDRLTDKSLELDDLLQEIGDLLAELTKYATVVAMPQNHKPSVSHVQLIPLDGKSCLLVLVLEGNIVRNRMIPLQKAVSEETLSRLSSILNRELSGLNVEQISSSVRSKVQSLSKADETLLKDVFTAITEALAEAEDTEVFTSGATNMLSFPEFSDIGHARTLMDFFSQKDQVRDMVRTEAKNSESGLTVRIGSENELESLQDCSIVTAQYKYGSRNLGAICVVGPMRMNYLMVVGILKKLHREFPQLFEDEGFSPSPEDGPDQDT